MMLSSLVNDNWEGVKKDRVMKNGTFLIAMTLKMMILAREEDMIRSGGANW